MLAACGWIVCAGEIGWVQKPGCDGPIFGRMALYSWEMLPQGHSTSTGPLHRAHACRFRRDGKPGCRLLAWMGRWCRQACREYDGIVVIGDDDIDIATILCSQRPCDTLRISVSDIRGPGCDYVQFPSMRSALLCENPPSRRHQTGDGRRPPEPADNDPLPPMPPLTTAQRHPHRPGGLIMDPRAKGG